MGPIIKFIIIIICFLITIFCKRPLSKLDLQFLRLAMFFTVLADLFLVVMGLNTIGVTLFCIVQLIYIVRYDTRHFNDIAKILFIILIILTGLYVFLYHFIYKFDIIILIALIYSVCIGLSLFKSLKAMEMKIYPQINGELVVWGMALFLLCDINVALSYLGIIEELSQSLIWLFYIPSQILLSFSGYNFYQK